MSAHLNLLRFKRLNPTRYKTSLPMRYKISARLNFLSCWALCTSFSIHRYKMTSSLSPAV